MTAFTLKIIAVVAMLVDHIGAAILRNTGVFVDYPLVYDISRYIGRIAFPIFAYLIANGCRHTKNINKYLLRLGILAILSEIPFDIAFNNGNINFLRQTNVFYTLFLGVASIAIYEYLKTKKKQWVMLLPFVLFPATFLLNFTPWAGHGYLALTIVGVLYVAAAYCIAYFLPENEEGKIGIKQKIIPVLAVLPILLPQLGTADNLQVDYGAWGVGLIYLLYIVNPAKKLNRALAMAAALIFFYGERQRLFSEFWTETAVYGEYIISRVLRPEALITLLCSLAAVVIIMFYNGKQGTKSQIVKWGFYAFYPLHIAILAAIMFIAV